MLLFFFFKRWKSYSACNPGWGFWNYTWPACCDVKGSQHWFLAAIWRGKFTVLNHAMLISGLFITCLYLIRCMNLLVIKCIRLQDCQICSRQTQRKVSVEMMMTCWAARTFLVQTPILARKGKGFWYEDTLLLLVLCCLKLGFPYSLSHQVCWFICFSLQRFLWDACHDLTLIILMVAAVASLALGMKTEVRDEIN